MVVVVVVELAITLSGLLMISSVLASAANSRKTFTVTLLASVGCCLATAPTDGAEVGVAFASSPAAGAAALLLASPAVASVVAAAADGVLGC